MNFLKIKNYKSTNKIILILQTIRKWIHALIISNFVNQDYQILHCKILYYQSFSQSNNLYDSMYQLNKVFSKNQ